MDDSTVKNVNDYLDLNHRDLGAILNKVKLLQDLSQKILAYLDPVMAQYCQVANLVNNTLVLIAANGSVATQLRFQSVDLLNKFRQDHKLNMIKAIECKVRPSILPALLSSTHPTNTIALLSQKTSKEVYEGAQSIADPKLREIMLRIASHVRKKEC